MNRNSQKEIFHNYDFSVYTASKYRDLKLETYRRITHQGEVLFLPVSECHIWLFSEEFEILENCFSFDKLSLSKFHD